MTNETLSQSEISIQIERLVNAFQYSHTQSFEMATDSTGESVAVTTSLTHDIWNLRRMYEFVVAVVDGYELSRHLSVFLEACQSIGIEFSPLVGMTCLDESESKYLSPEETLEMLRQRIHELTLSPLFQRLQNDWKYHTKRSGRKAVSYLHRLLDRHDRLVIVRAKLTYLPEAAAALRVEQVFADLEQLMRERKRRSISRYEVGHLCSVEQGGTGFFVPVTFFFDATYIKSDWNKAHSLGELWREVTEGRGGYCCWNHDKTVSAADMGIGTLDRNDEVATEIAADVLQHLAQARGRLQIKPLRAKRVRIGSTR